MAHGSGSACAEKQKAEGRDGRGRFAKGNKGGPGNPYARKMAALKKALMDYVQPEDIVDVAIILMLQAKQGNHAAVKLLFSYVLGLPKDQVDPDRLDQDEWQIWMESIISEKDIGRLDLGMPIDRVNDLAAQRVQEQRAIFDSLYTPMTNGGNGQVAPSANGSGRDQERGTPPRNGSGGEHGKGERMTNGSGGGQESPMANGRSGEEKWTGPIRNGSVGVEVPGTPKGNGSRGDHRPPKETGSDGGRSTEEYLLLIEEGLWQTGTMVVQDDPERIGARVLADAMRDLEAPLANGLNDEVFLHALELIGLFNARLKEEMLQGTGPDGNGADGGRAEREYQVAAQRMRLVTEAVRRIYRACKGRAVGCGSGRG